MSPSFFERNRAELVRRGYETDRLPPGQYFMERFPVLHVGGKPSKLSSSAIRRAIHGGVPATLALTGAAPVTGDVVPLDDRRPLAHATPFSLMTA